MYPFFALPGRLVQAQLLELSLSMSALIGLHSEADAALHRPFVSVLYYLAGCVDLGEAYLPAEQDEERQPGPRKTGSKGSRSVFSFTMDRY